MLKFKNKKGGSKMKGKGILFTLFMFIFTGTLLAQEGGEKTDVYNKIYKKRLTLLEIKGQELYFMEYEGLPFVIDTPFEELYSQGTITDLNGNILTEIPLPCVVEIEYTLTDEEKGFMYKIKKLKFISSYTVPHME
jgi:hypothetical protein